MTAAHTYFLRSFGCQMNEHDAERIRALLEGQGLERVADPAAADVLVYNTCTVRKSADERLAGHLSTAARLKREDPRKVVVVTGCLPQSEKQALFEHFPFVDAAVGPQSLHRLPEALSVALSASHGLSGSPTVCSSGLGRAVDAGGRASAPCPPLGYFEDEGCMSGDLPARRQRRFQAWVQIMSGCTNYCAYCIVPFVRGPERSRLPETIESEVRCLVADGVKEVTLLGQNVNAYGRDLAAAGAPAGTPTPTFAALLRRLDRVPGLGRVRFMTSHPKDLSNELVAAIAELPSVCEHVHLPAQSGSDRVLRAMKRGYTAARYLERVAALRAAVPEVAITSDLIVGFPGETEEDFRATLHLVERAGFDAAFTFVYSPRPGSAAADYPDLLSGEVKRERVERLIEFTQHQAAQRRAAAVGKTCEVLVEGPSRRGGLLRGRTRQNVTVNFSGRARPGDLIPVRITSATSTTLRGSV